MTLYREFTLRGPAPWQMLVAFVKSNAKACVDRGHPLRVIVTEDDRKRNVEQNARYWKLLSIIAEQAWVEGQQFGREAWHEHFARQFLPLKEVILPGGEIVQIRQTTTTLKVGEFSDYMQKVEASAASDLGVEFAQ